MRCANPCIGLVFFKLAKTINPKTLSPETYKQGFHSSSGDKQLTVITCNYLILSGCVIWTWAWANVGVGTNMLRYGLRYGLPIIGAY